MNITQEQIEQASATLGDAQISFYFIHHEGMSIKAERDVGHRTEIYEKHISIRMLCYAMDLDKLWDEFINEAIAAWSNE